ncbi:RNase H [Pseudothermotoga hypogea DSM 11164 = NBRC 106472]|uniref:Ribonuclease H n=1 Tax=Pseudothermotoga hypogea DSM 11164 = NBRC 106472 TaxID=1123384 RepID=A0A0X1KNQ6_9THEM|nr:MULTISPECIES: ribonuclease H family protein [Pseudothermotoga]AJC72858.1 RNase H [Pseudothermotoga hypogea DSM 11164 = NBRC 106472]MDI6862510.1 ribonuclease H family protein [Pseudothermotoga sp.]
MGKYYAVKRGRCPGIYEDWQRAREQVEGFPNAEYRSFASKADALAYLRGETWRCPDFMKDTILVCVDGSYRDGVCGSGIVVCDQEGLREFYFWTDEPDLAKMRNVAGEILAVLFAVNYALQRGTKRLVIRHDFENLDKWISGEYRTKTFLTEIYREFVDFAKRKNLRIEFEKIKAHSKDPCNERADGLAKLATGRKRNVDWKLEVLRDVIRSDESN